MPLLVADDERVFPLDQIEFVDATIDDLFQRILALRRAAMPWYTDESAADFGTHLLWTFATLADWLRLHLERIKADSFIGTTQSREAMRLLCELLDYQLGEASAASAIVTFDLASGHPEFAIPKGTKIGARPRADQAVIVFETAQDALIPEGTSSINITCVHGETVTNEVIGSSIGITHQRFPLSRRPVVWHSESVQVFDGNAWAPWTRVDNFANVLAGNWYRVEVDKDGIYWIVFGDGVRGRIPVRGDNNIRCSYRQGGGAVGNVGPNTINVLMTQVQYVTGVDNDRAATGGTDKETLENARVFAPASLRTLQRAVTPTDIETLADSFSSPTFGGIAKSKVILSNSPTAKVMIVPRSGGYPSSGLKSALQDYLTERIVVGRRVEVIEPQYYPITVTAIVQVTSGALPSQVADDIRRKLVAYLSPAYQDPETGLYPRVLKQNIYLSRIYNLIMTTAGVTYCTVSEPAGDITIPSYQIADLGVINLTVSTPTEEYSYQGLKG